MLQYLQYVAGFSVLQCVAVCLQIGAPWYEHSLLLYVAMCCGMLQCTCKEGRPGTSTVLLCVAVCSTVMQFVHQVERHGTNTV